MKGVSVSVICVGKLKEKFYIEGAAEYAKRLGAYCKFQLTELSEERLPQNPSRAQIDAALEKEAQAVKSRLPKGAAVVALCVEGELLSSEKLTARLEQLEECPDRSAQNRALLAQVLEDEALLLDEIIQQITVGTDSFLIQPAELPLQFEVRARGTGTGRNYRTQVLSCDVRPLPPPL